MAFFESHPDRDFLFNGIILKRWSVTVAEAAGRGAKFLDDVEQTLKALGIPDLVTKRGELETGRDNERAKGRDVRPSLLINVSTEPIKYYDTYVSAQDYGRHLILSRLVRGTARSHSQFETEAISAFLSLVNAATLDVAKKISDEVNQEFSKAGKQPPLGMIDIV
jgi:hypothetical protein